MSAPFRLLVESGPNVGQTFALSGTDMTIGRQENNAVVLDDPRLSRRHVRIQVSQGGLLVTDLGSVNGTRLNGAPLQGTQPLRPGDRLQLGVTTLRVEGGPLHQEAAAATVAADVPASLRVAPTSGPRLIAQGGMQDGQVFPLNRPALIAGRQPGIDIVLDDSQASRQHARFDRVGDQVTVTDLGSINGTRVNGQPISGTQPLREGDVVQIGMSLLRVAGLTPAAEGAGQPTVVPPASGFGAPPYAAPTGPLAVPPPAASYGAPPAFGPPPPPVAPLIPPPAPPAHGPNRLPLILAAVAALLLVSCVALAGGGFLVLRSRQSPTATPSSAANEPGGTTIAAGPASPTTNGTPNSLPAVTPAVSASLPPSAATSPTIALGPGSGGGNPGPPAPGVTSTTSLAPTTVPTPTPRPSATATAPRPTTAPTRTPAAAPTSPPAAGGGTTYTARSYGLQFIVPAGWTKASETATSVTFLSPDRKAQFTANWGPARTGVTAQSRLQDELQTTTRVDASFNPNTVTVSSARIGGQAGAQTSQYDYTNQNNTAITELDAAVVLPGRALYFFGFLSLQGQFDAHLDEFRAISDSINITGP